MTQPMTVEQDELLARASEVEEPMGDPPNGVPTPPCSLKAASTAAQQLILSADNMRTYLAAGQRERERLAQSLRNAAKAYGDVDEEAAAAMDNDGDGDVAPETAGPGGDDPSAGLHDTETAPAAGEPDFTDLKTAATKLESGDQGSTFADFANFWNSYNLALQGTLQRFRPFQSWEGDAAAACEESLDQQQTWVIHMAKLSAALSKQAAFVVQLHRWARQSHPTLADIVKLEELSKDPTYKNEAIKLYAEYQQKSEEVLAEYATKAALDPVNPPKPPAAIKIDPPPPPATPGLIPSVFMPPGDGTGTPAAGMPAAPMMPATGAGAGGVPAGAGAQLASAAREAAGGMPGDLAVKAASLGGGGGGAPSMPLGPAVGNAESMRPAAAGELAGMGPGKGPGGGAMGGGGMGMPMGAGAQGQGGAKSKGGQQDDEALYTEDRAWTEAVIGNRRRQDSKESK